MSKLYAKAGEIVTNGRGEKICRVAQDIYSSDRSSIDCFDEWTIEPPQKGAAVEWAVNDENAWVTGNGFAMWLRINGEWRASEFGNLPEG